MFVYDFIFICRTCCYALHQTTYVIWKRSATATSYVSMQLCFFISFRLSAIYSNRFFFVCSFIAFFSSNMIFHYKQAILFGFFFLISLSFFFFHLILFIFSRCSRFRYTCRCRKGRKNSTRTIYCLVGVLYLTVVLVLHFTLHSI